MWNMGNCAFDRCWNNPTAKHIEIFSEGTVREKPCWCNFNALLCTLKSEHYSAAIILKPICDVEIEKVTFTHPINPTTFKPISMWAAFMDAIPLLCLIISKNLPQVGHEEVVQRQRRVIKLSVDFCCSCCSVCTLTVHHSELEEQWSSTGSKIHTDIWAYGLSIGVKRTIWKSTLYKEFCSFFLFRTKNVYFHVTSESDNAGPLMFWKTIGNHDEYLIKLFFRQNRYFVFLSGDLLKSHDKTQDKKKLRKIRCKVRNFFTKCFLNIWIHHLVDQLKRKHCPSKKAESTESIKELTDNIESWLHSKNETSIVLALDDVSNSNNLVFTETLFQLLNKYWQEHIQKADGRSTALLRVPT